MAEFQSLMTYFGENAKDTISRNTFYSKFLNFVTEFTKAHIENVQKEEEQNILDTRKRIVSSAKKADACSSPNTGNNTGNNTDTDSAIEEDKAELEENEEEEDDEDSNHSTVMDTLLEKLRTSGASQTTESTKPTNSERRSIRRQKALSFYSSTTADEYEDTPPEDITATSNEYDSINDLKRRLTKRRRDLNTPSSTSSVNSDTTLLRTQAMLKQLRKSEENLNKTYKSVSHD